MKVETTRLDTISLPKYVDYYIILDDGSLEEGVTPEANVFIDAVQAHYLSDRESMKFVRENYGARLGVMHNSVYTVQPSESRTLKVLLSAVKK